MRPIDKLKVKIALSTLVVVPPSTRKGKPVEGYAYPRRNKAITNFLRNPSKSITDPVAQIRVQQEARELKGWRALGITSVEINAAAEDLISQEDHADKLALDSWGIGFEFALTELTRASQMHASGKKLSDEQAQLVEHVNAGLDALKAYAEDFKANKDAASGKEGVRLFSIIGMIGRLGQESLRRATGTSKEEWDRIFNWEGAKNVQLSEEGLADFEPDFDKATLIALLLFLEQIQESEPDES